MRHLDQEKGAEGEVSSKIKSCVMNPAVIADNSYLGCIYKIAKLTMCKR
jgi:hypothetical protein